MGANPSPRNVLLVGSGGIVRHHHLKEILKDSTASRVVAIAEPSAESREAAGKLFREAGETVPPGFSGLDEALAAKSGADTALIATPHKFHFEQTRACLEAGLDVFLEKPMVMNAREAVDLIAIRDRTGRKLVVGFPGSLSGAIRKAKAMIAAGELGEVSSIAGLVHQQWKKKTTGSWRQDPEMSGGGFLFDTGSHMINTMVDLAGADVAAVSALFDNRGVPVEINSAIAGQFSNGITFSAHAAGDSIRCESEVFVYGSEAVLRTGIWGERLEIKKGRGTPFEPVDFPGAGSTWQQFLRVLAGEQANTCPPEVGLRFARLMDMVRMSAESGRRIAPTDLPAGG